ncbi:hypothetical protein KTS45_05135 [Halomicroarcula limicola]|uniref:Uncharacterized protein n=1 Tax=Haloarcula limicola TaxID=1429915 RepID=A0A8J8C3Z3_9EURY|nr:hypothetical protein [Halomicroarcula limicola]MBV0923579.1 hypothetical protein [Halomicroarcula limicola]
MSQTDHPTTAETDSAYREYVLGVRILEESDVDGGARYRFEAPDHCGIAFEDAEDATLYADVYFDVNGFEEAGTGERGVPPAIIQAGRDTLVAYFLTQSGIDVHWAASFYGEKPEKVERYVSRVRKRAANIRDGVRERDLS